MTRNPETTEAARAPQQPSREEQVRQALSGLASSLRRIRESLQSAEQCSEALAVLAVSPAVTEQDERCIHNCEPENCWHVPDSPSPAVTEGERATELARRAGFAEGLRDAADEAGSWGHSAAHIAMQLRAKAERVEQFNIARTPAAPSPAVTAAEDETRD